ncbi:hypothetical protein DRA42_08630 [Ethanoligenens harbinense]|nr:hypothetical protein CXQ68_08600 [Ethanoligenens harbinense YUAN-3]AYF38936.1 hypothetical protein CXP51_08470 [Ethanoligenens harbinense]AYF41688.1 hypothetical protein CN246_08620 [Ethanoligenens harbinense]QCN92518.1 hypothetical protein DRA42_08630 [Ethanoligenens harbinense]
MYHIASLSAANLHFLTGVFLHFITGADNGDMAYCKPSTRSTRFCQITSKRASFFPLPLHSEQ